MARYVFVVLTAPVEGREDEYNRWYDEVHVPDVLRVKGCVAARRFRYADVVEKGSPWPYLALYEWEADSIDSARDALTNAREAGAIEVADSLDVARTSAWFFELIT